MLWPFVRNPWSQFREHNRCRLSLLPQHTISCRPHQSSSSCQQWLTYYEYLLQLFCSFSQWSESTESSLACSLYLVFSDDEVLSCKCDSCCDRRHTSVVHLLRNICQQWLVQVSSTFFTHIFVLNADGNNSHAAQKYKSTLALYLQVLRY